MDDLISGQAAKNKKVYSEERHEYVVPVAEIDWLPSVQPQRWIPVSEALPDAGVEVWVTINGHDVIKCKPGETIEQAIDRISKIRWVTRGYWSEEEHGWNDPSFGCPLMVKPIAWMPMEVPEPWRGGQDE